MPTPTGNNPFAYEGVVATSPPNVVTALRAPTTADIGYIVGTIWINTTTSSVYYLASNRAGTATWNNIVASGAAASFSSVTATGSTGFVTNGGATVTSGTGAPASTAPKGSLYLRLDGSSTATRAYINTDGATTWTNLVTAA